MKKITLELSYDPAVPPLGIYLKDLDPTAAYLHIHIFCNGEKWNQPRFPSTTEEIMKMCYLCTMKYFSSIKEMKSGSLLVFIFQFQELENGYAE